MTPIAGRSVALIAALSSGIAFYRGCYLTATALGAVVYVALASIKQLPKERPVRKLLRSQSAPELASGVNPREEIRSVAPMTETPLTSLLASPPEKPPPLEPRSQPLVKVSDLPRMNWAIWKFRRNFFPPPHEPATLVAGVVNAQYLPPGTQLHLDVREYLGTSEIFVAKGSDKLIRGQRGGWVLFPRLEADALEMQAVWSKVFRRKVLIVLGNKVSFSPRSIAGIDYREFVFDEFKKNLLVDHPFIRDGGEIRYYFRLLPLLQLQELNKDPELDRIVSLPSRLEVEGSEHYLLFRTRPERER